MKISRLLSVILFVLVLIFLPIKQYKLSSPMSELQFPDTLHSLEITANLIDLSENRRITFTPSLVHANITEFGEYQLTYEVGIPKHYLDDQGSANPQSYIFNPFPIEVFATSSSYNRCDSTESICAILSIRFTQIFNHGWILDSSNQWINRESSITWSEAKMEVACLAEYFDKSGKCDDKNTKIIGIPTNEEIYTITPSFAGNDNDLYFNDLNGIAVNQSILLTSEGKTWKFSFCINYAADAIIISCN